MVEITKKILLYILIFICGIASVFIYQASTKDKEETEDITENTTLNAINETSYEQLYDETSYIEIAIEESLTYSIYEYDNLDDYTNHLNKKLVKTVNKGEYEAIPIEMKDIVKNDYPAEYLSDRIITENILENKYLSLNLNDSFNFMNSDNYYNEINNNDDDDDDGIKVAVSGFEPMNFMEAELQILTGDDKNKLYFQVGFPATQTDFRLIPLYSVVADNKVIESRIIMPNNQLDYKFFASADLNTDKPATLIMVDKTREIVK